MPKKRKSFLAFLFLLLACGMPLSHAEVVDKIAAIVNDEIITQRDLDRVLLPIYAQYKNLYDERELAEKIDEARKNALKRLVEDKLLLSEAKRKEIEVTAGELETRMEEIRMRFSTEKEFETALTGEGISLGELKKRFKERIMIEKFVDSELNIKISVSPNELLGYYESHLSEFREPISLRVRAILVKIKKERPEEGALKLAQKILYRLREGIDFGLLARQHSDGPYADSGGDMGWVEEGQLMERIDSLIFQMDEGDISGILKTKLGFHIFKVEEKKESGTKSFVEEKGRIEQLLYNKKREEALRNLLKELKENAYIAFR